MSKQNQSWKREKLIMLSGFVLALCGGLVMIWQVLPGFVLLLISVVVLIYAVVRWHGWS